MEIRPCAGELARGAFPAPHPFDLAQILGLQGNELLGAGEHRPGRGCTELADIGRPLEKILQCGIGGGIAKVFLRRLQAFALLVGVKPTLLCRCTLVRTRGRSGPSPLWL